ncbi:hypothetical protein OXPF_05880 [Oxobacter pfennigii]|uniref:Uncharacterized protein n=1 Tax=Oxobacter pfennigii TaxID=36849 RepID=A0A0P8WD50_9CLOT|nr:hypothetical protein [Oxobacter pfennigii]KPU45799.1 hypothetical protein OXPF_05880 [Oxobacter pfennigii]
MANIYDIDAYVDQIALRSFVRSFSPIAVSKVLNLPLNPVIERLNYLKDGKKLTLKYEIRCYEDSNIIKVVDDFSGFIGKKLYCKNCDDEIEVGLDNIFPVYYIDDDYREYLKKN